MSLAVSAPAPQDKRVPGVALRLILQGIRDVAGSQFPRLLEQAGLGQYTETLPPADQTPTVTEVQLSGLYGTTFRVMGESLTRLFLTNYGRQLPEALLASSWGQEMQAKVAQVPASERLATAVRLIAETGTKLWVQMSVTEDSEAWYLEVTGCATCRSIQGARAPICANNEIFYGSVARALTGMRLTALEVECAAQGASRCRYRLRK